mmetsp:Transcript_2473/g.7308  ORF Transcript_2473/g.7308 Transcript_2473/m.7308 type:complete len:461 (+) Transcript_2473:33-1415(+)
MPTRKQARADVKRDHRAGIPGGLASWQAQPMIRSSGRHAHVQVKYLGNLHGRTEGGIAVVPLEGIAVPDHHELHVYQLHLHDVPHGVVLPDDVQHHVRPTPRRRSLQPVLASDDAHGAGLRGDELHSTQHALAAVQEDGAPRSIKGEGRRDGPSEATGVRQFPSGAWRFGLVEARPQRALLQDAPAALRRRHLFEVEAASGHAVGGGGGRVHSAHAPRNLGAVLLQPPMPCMGSQHELHHAARVLRLAPGRRLEARGQGRVHGLHERRIGMLLADEPQDRVVDGAVAELHLAVDLLVHQLLQLPAGVHRADEGQEEGADHRHERPDREHGLRPAVEGQAVGALVVAGRALRLRLVAWEPGVEELGPDRPKPPWRRAGELRRLVHHCQLQRPPAEVRLPEVQALLRLLVALSQSIFGCHPTFSRQQVCGHLALARTCRSPVPGLAEADSAPRGSNALIGGQ